MRQMRLLAPAGSPEALRAAVYAGADAVYAGGSQYGARSFAANFDREELREAVAFCHQWGVAFYQTLNTLIGDREREDFLRQAEYANEIGVDGVIVQDVGMMAQIARRFPDLPISGSTQMSVTTLDGVLRAQQLGASRVVLARELPLSQIAYICERSPIEIEVFLHGALCMCYSGQCYMSALLGQRSGNRGQCAQPCRLPYRLESGRQAHPLSLKDLCGAGWLEQLRQAGVSVLKIEGRMKRPEYVGVVTDVYQRLLRERREPTAQEMERLTTIFSRQGFTQGYLEDHTGPAMFGTRSENEDTPAFRQLVKEAAAEYQEKHARRRVPVRFSCSLRAGEPFALTLEDGIHSVTARGEVPQPALRRAVGEEEIRAQLSRLGGTPFVLESLTGEVQEGLSLPASAINALRRELVEQLLEQRSRPPRRRSLPGEQPPREEKRVSGQWQWTVQVPSLAYLTPVLTQGMTRVYVPLEEIQREEEARRWWMAGTPLVPVLPRVWFDREQPRVEELLNRWKALGAEQVLCGNVGQAALAGRLGLTPLGDYSLNLYNSHTAWEYEKMGFGLLTPSIELRREQIGALHSKVPLELVAYGKTPMMITQNCVVEGSHPGCGKCREGWYLTDRKGEKLLVRRAFGCRNELFNPHPLYLADRLEEWQGMGLVSLRLCFTDESPRQAEEVVQAYRQRQDWRPGAFTRGLYTKGVK